MLPAAAVGCRYSLLDCLGFFSGSPVGLNTSSVHVNSNGRGPTHNMYHLPDEYIYIHVFLVEQMNRLAVCVCVPIFISDEKILVFYYYFRGKLSMTPRIYLAIRPVGFFEIQMTGNVFAIQMVRDIGEGPY
jgi:hypothetical protein